MSTKKAAKKVTALKALSIEIGGESVLIKSVPQIRRLAGLHGFDPEIPIKIFNQYAPKARRGGKS